jgi:DNA-binding MarR family transcriptional regulator
MDVDDDDAVRLRRAVTKLARHFNASATDEHLTPTQASVLALVSVRGPVSLSELVRLEHLNPTMLSRVVAALVDAGLVLRTPDPEDLRSVRLSVTDDGRDRHLRIRGRRAEDVARWVSRLTDDARATLFAALPALEELAQNVD